MYLSLNQAIMKTDLNTSEAMSVATYKCLVFGPLAPPIDAFCKTRKNPLGTVFIECVRQGHGLISGQATGPLRQAMGPPGSGAGVGIGMLRGKGTT